MMSLNEHAQPISGSLDLYQPGTVACQIETISPRVGEIGTNALLTNCGLAANANCPAFSRHKGFAGQFVYVRLKAANAP